MNPRSPAAISRYRRALKSIPPAGGGGCHPALLGTANLGVAAGLQSWEVFNDLRRYVHGSRTVPDREIQAAVAKAFQDRGGPTVPLIQPMPTVNGELMRRKIVAAAGSVTEATIVAASPVPIDPNPVTHTALLLRHLFHPDDLVYVGEPTSVNPNLLLPVGELMGDPDVANLVTHIVVNPLKGGHFAKKDGTGLSIRCDAAVAKFRHAVIEFDTIPVAEQVSFFAGLELPIAALAHSGGKSVHAWMRVDAGDEADWDARVRPLFKHYLRAMGADSTCQNPSRMTRLPGCCRHDKGQWQRLLFLDPAAKGVRAALRKGVRS